MAIPSKTKKILKIKQRVILQTELKQTTGTCINHNFIKPWMFFRVKFVSSSYINAWTCINIKRFHLLRVGTFLQSSHGYPLYIKKSCQRRLDWVDSNLLATQKKREKRITQLSCCCKQFILQKKYGNGLDLIFRKKKYHLPLIQSITVGFSRYGKSLFCFHHLSNLSVQPSWRTLGSFY